MSNTSPVPDSASGEHTYTNDTDSGDFRLYLKDRSSSPWSSQKPPPPSGEPDSTDHHPYHHDFPDPLRHQTDRHLAVPTHIKGGYLSRGDSMGAMSDLSNDRRLGSRSHSSPDRASTRASMRSGATPDPYSVHGGPSCIPSAEERSQELAGIGGPTSEPGDHETEDEEEADLFADLDGDSRELLLVHPKPRRVPNHPFVAELVTDEVSPPEESARYDQEAEEITQRMYPDEAVGGSAIHTVQ